MAISRQRKTELVAQYVEQLKQSQGIILADYRGLTMGNMSTIRKALHPVKSKFQVVQNRLLALALKEMGMSVPEEWLTEPTAVSFCYAEVPPVARALMDAAKEMELLHIKGGLAGTSVIAAEQVRTIADLPSREVLLAQVLGTINAPASRVSGTIASGIRQVLNVLQAYVDKLQEASGGANAAMAQVAVG